MNFVQDTGFGNFTQKNMNFDGIPYFFVVFVVLNYNTADSSFL
jgi:hypothetical protein